MKEKDITRVFNMFVNKNLIRMIYFFVKKS